MTNDIVWDKGVQAQFDQILAKVPIFMRPIAQKKVYQHAVDVVVKDGRNLVTEKDLVDAFFAATPFGFHGPMKADMESIGLDYKKYGYAA